jgi:hypothetical protein
MDTQLDIFYNTTNLAGPKLKAREIKTGTQNAVILQWFKENPGRLYTPFDIKHNCFLFNTPITSIRRAMTTLTDMGYLEKTDERRPGLYGDLNYCWRLR